MKELMSISSNVIFLEGEEGELTANVELIVIVSEPLWQGDGGGGIGKSRVAENYRFAVKAAQLRKLAEILIEHADEADEALARVTSRKAEPPLTLDLAPTPTKGDPAQA